MNALLKLILIFCGAITLNTGLSQQLVPRKVIDSTAGNSGNQLYYAKNKLLPAGYERETLEALSYFPELHDVTIRFKITKSFSTLKTRPSFWSALMPKGHRSYTIIISNKTTTKLMPLMFNNLSYDARVGVIGHELSHVVYFSENTTWKCLKTLIGHLSSRYLDRFEYNTDMICIHHGLGKDLEAWSSYIRNTMHTTFWRGAGYVNKYNPNHERYMNPSTIEKNIRVVTETGDQNHNQ